MSLFNGNITAIGKRQVQTKAYYVSSSGNDSNDGLSPNSPFASITKVNTLDLSGDIKQVLFKKGDSFNGTLVIPSSGTAVSPVKIGAYGTGNLPKIYGSDIITGWSLHSGNIYKATFNTPITQLFLNDERLTLARYDNAGVMFNVTTVNSQTQLTSTEITSQAVDYYKGSTLIIKTNDWRLDTRTITASSGQTLTFNSALSYTLVNGTDFYLCNKLEFLTSPGEWYYDTATSTVYLWKPDGTQPSDTEVRGSVRQKGIYASGKSYVTIENLNIVGQKDYGIHLETCPNTKLQNCSFYGIELHAISMGGDNSIVRNNYVDSINYIPVSISSANSFVEDNVVVNSALYENLGLLGMNGFSYALSVSGNGSRIRYNRVIDSGFMGIVWSGLNSIVERNYIEGACRCLTDGGSIYTFTQNGVVPSTTSGSTVRYNIVNGSRGMASIYLDNNSGEVLITNNTVLESNGYGLFNNNNGHNNVFEYNTLFNCHELRHNLSIVNSIMRYNVVCLNDVGTLTHRCAFKLSYESGALFDYNTYIDRYKSASFTTELNSYQVLDFNAWKATTGNDANSTFIGTALAAGEKQAIYFNNTKVQKVFYLNEASNVKNDVTGATITDQFSLSPFTSLIVSGLNLDCISETRDTASPVITSFSIPSTSSSLTVPISTFVVSGNPTKYKITETNNVPTLESSGWSSAIPTEYVFNSEGSKTLYAWARDAAGNISNYAEDSVIISIPIYLKTGMAAFYEFENDGTTLNDVHTNGLNGTNYQSTTKVAGMPGNAYSYNYNTLRSTTINDAGALNFTGAFTISAWINITDLAATRSIISKMHASYKEFTIWVTTDGKIEARMYENGGTTYTRAYTPVGSITTGNNILVEVMMDSSKRIRDGGMTILINNVVQTLTFSGSIWDLTVGVADTAAPLVIGYDSVNVAAFLGKISQVGIWTKKLSVDERNLLYNNGAGTNYSSMQ